MGLISIAILLFLARHFIIELNENKKHIEQRKEKEKRLEEKIIEQQKEIDELKNKIK